MSLDRYNTLFEAYLLNIALTKQQATNIDTKLSEAIALFLSTYEGDLDIYAQGSYAMGTIVRPLTEKQNPSGKAGEYDIDIALERSHWSGAQDTLQDVRTVLEDEYGELVDQKLRESCERVRHNIDDDTGVDFHVDYVPIKQLDGRNAAKRSSDKWFPSDTKQLIKWFSEYSETYTFLPGLILIFKRIRDFADLREDIPSICITALACMYYEDKGSYADDLLNVLEKVVAHFSVPYSQLSIKIDPIDDDLAIKISETSHSKLFSFFTNCAKELRVGFTNEDILSMQKYLSSSFPVNLGDYPEFLEALRNRDIGIELDGSLNIVDINEDHGKGSYVSHVRRKFFSSGEKLIFRASEYDKQLFGIRWQVLNSDESPIGKRRGNLFHARGADGNEGSSSNDFVNHETEQYSGEHWIKYYIYKKETKLVVEIGRKFFVEVEK